MGMPGAFGDGLRLLELSWPEVEAAVNETKTVLLPVGAVEQHGHHLPLGVDVFMPVGVCERVADRTGCLVAPAVPYGVSPHHRFKPGTFTVESETFQRYVRDVAGSVREWGVQNVLLVNGHYHAQDPELEIVVRSLRTDYNLRAFHVPLVSVFRDAAERVRESAVAFHAAEFETSLMLALHPDLVRLDHAQSVAPPDEALPLTAYDALGDNRVGWALTREDMDRLTPAGNIGDPTTATREAGDALLEDAVNNIVELVEALEDSPEDA